jgi:hypothetical protein
MYVFLLVLGAVITATGLALLGSGVSIQEHAFDPATVTPGVVAAIGGLIVVGLGLAVRVLQRIEQALAVRPMPRAAVPVEVVSTAVPEPPSGPVLVPVASNPATEIQEPAAAAAANPAPFPATAADLTLEQFREKFPTVVRFENGPLAAESEVPLLLPDPPGRTEQQTAAFANGHAVGGANGAAMPVKLVPPLDAGARPVANQDRRKPSVFESLWPKGPRAGRQGQTAVAPAPLPPPSEPDLVVEPKGDAQPAMIPQQAPMPVSILKSGVVDGMAYTLYSDGSIEAQLPQGTLRFGSITELRNHIEHSA